MREMRALWSFILLLSVIVQATTGQAPGDEDERCLEDVVNSEEVLMSSSNYRNLVEGVTGVGPWTVVNDDDNNDGLTLASRTTWTQSGTTCERNVGVCGFESGPQDNWLITQFIDNTMRQAVIYIRVRYAINSQCGGGEGSGAGCLTRTTLDTYVLQTNTSDMSFTSNISNIFVTRPIAALTDTVRDGATIVTRILPVMADLSTTGLYVAFRDLGICIVLVEVTVFYPVCDPILVDVGANFSVLGFPGDTSSGVCFTNMAISINPLENSFTATCTLTSMLMSLQQTDQLFTNWTINGDALPQCMCLPGYEFTNRTTSLQCRACEPFHFKNTLSNTEMCKPCPLFSNTTEPAMEVCPCDDGHFRPSDGSEDAMNCTRPPSAPQNIAVSDVTNTSVIIMWEPPEDNGDRTDLFYSISHNVTDDIFNTTSTNMMLTGLIPFVYYELRVTADNRVSSQDNNTNARTVTISIMTEGGVGGDIDGSSIHNVNGERLTWDPPEFPQGMIIHYEVLVNGSTFTTPTNEIDINSLDLAPGVHFIQVRAVTSVGPGNYSDPIRLTITGDNSGSSVDSSVIIGGVMGGVILLLMATVVMFIVIMCIMKRPRRKEAAPHVYDVVPYNITKLNTNGTNHEAADNLHRTIKKDLNAPITNLSCPVSTMSYSNGSEYDSVLPNEHASLHDSVTMDTNPSYGVSTVEDRAKVFSTTAAYYNTKAHQLSQQNNSPQIPRNTVTSTTGDIKQNKVQLHSTLDQEHNTTHLHLIANGTKLTGKNDYGVINQPRCDDPNFDTIVDQRHTGKSNLLLSSKSVDENEYGIINQPQCNDCLPLTTNTKLTGENKYGVINQPQCDDPSFESCLPHTNINTKLTGENKYGVINQLRCDDHSIDTIVDQNSDTDEGGYGVINQPQCDDFV